jgi:hypothetical protein
MSIVRTVRKVGQVAEALRQFRRPPGRHEVVDDAVDAGDHGVDHAARHRRRPGPARRLGEEHRIGVQQLPPAGPRAWPRGEHLHHRQRGEGRLGRQDPQQRVETAVHPLRPAGRPGVRRGDRFLQQGDPALEGGQEARLLVGEVLVEGAGGDPGGGAHLAEGGVGVAALGHRAGHRVDEAVALGPADEFPGEIVASAGQQPVRLGGRPRARNALVGMRRLGHRHLPPPPLRPA